MQSRAIPHGACNIQRAQHTTSAILYLSHISADILISSDTMNSIAAISQCFSQLSSIFPQVCLIANQLACYFLGVRRVPQRSKHARIACVLQMPVKFDEIRFRSISSSSEGCYITTGKALKSSVTPKNTM